MPWQNSWVLAQKPFKKKHFCKTWSPKTFSRVLELFRHGPRAPWSDLCVSFLGGEWEWFWSLKPAQEMMGFWWYLHQVCVSDTIFLGWKLVLPTWKCSRQLDWLDVLPSWRCECNLPKFFRFKKVAWPRPRMGMSNCFSLETTMVTTTFLQSFAMFMSWFVEI